MVAQLQIGGYEIEFDRDATAACYARIHTPRPEACRCAYCRNWIAAREHILPPDFRQLLSQFSIPTDGEIEVWQTPGQKLAHFYGGWYFIVGRILSGERGHKFDMGSFGVSFNSEKSYAVREFEGHQICELHFHTETAEYLSKEEYTKTPQPRILR
jgi:hypothetical protein